MTRRGRRTGYYAREAGRRLRHYAVTRIRGYRNHGSLPEAARTILAERARSGFAAGGHFRGVWPRDLCFAAPGFRAAGYGPDLRSAGDRLVDVQTESDVFLTDVHREYAAAVPDRGVDTFPALVILLAAVDGLAENETTIRSLAARHRQQFFDDRRSLVTGNGSSWWDSAVTPRETYNTAMLLTAAERLAECGVETTYAGHRTEIRAAMRDRLWTGTHFAEHRTSTVIACDANVVPLYFGLVDDDRARSIVRTLDGLETPCGLRMREEPFTRREVHPYFFFHRDYHYHVWPWNSLMYAIALHRYGFTDRAQRELARVESVLSEYGTFLEIVTLSGEPYARRGYASAGDFTVAAALWMELTDELAATGSRRS